MNLLIKTCVAIGVLVIGGCASSPELKYSSDYSGVIEFSKKMIVELSAGADKLLSQQHNRVIDKGDFVEYNGAFFPRSGTQGVLNSYKNYCEGLGGSYGNGECVKQNTSEILFYARVSSALETTSIECSSGTTTYGANDCGRNQNLRKIQPVAVNQDLRVWLKVYEPKKNVDPEVFKRAVTSVEK